MYTTIIQNPLHSQIFSPIIANIRKILYEMHNKNIQVVLTWIPSHVGIEGNETADIIAKQAVVTEPENVPFWVERYDRLSELETRQFLAKKVLLDQNAVSPKYKNYDEKDIIGLQQRMVLKSLITGYKKDGEMLKSKDVDKVALKQVLLPKTTQLTYANLGARLDPITLSNLTEVYEKTYPDKGVIEMGRIMKPVGPETSKIIMDEGALSYLKARLKHAPNEKYYFPACSSWEYNWKPDECKIAGYPNNFAKVARLQRSLSQPNPIKVDPKHYRQPFKQRDKRG